MAVVLWLAIGMVFEASYNGWSFVKAFYFAFFALSTGGLQAPQIDGSIDRYIQTYMVERRMHDTHSEIGRDRCMDYRFMPPHVYLFMAI